MAKYIDTHVHYYDEAFTSEEEADAAIGRSVEAGVIKMIQADVGSAERDRMLRQTARYPGVLYHMLGLYPGSVGEGWEKEIEQICARLEDSSPVAIGEIGLDYHCGCETAPLQKLALKEQLRIASLNGLPVNIHLRDATEDFFSVLDECRSLPLRGNLHAFSGSWETFCRLRDYGDWSVGIGGVVTFKNSRLPSVVEKIPLEFILLETDTPYLSPAPYRGQKNDSSRLPLVAAKIAEIKGLDPEEVAARTTENAIRLFSLK